MKKNSMKPAPGDKKISKNLKDEGKHNKALKLKPATPKMKRGGKTE